MPQPNNGHHGLEDREIEKSGKKEKLSSVLVKRVVKSLIPGMYKLYPSASNDGSSAIGSIIYYIVLALMGQTIKGEYSYKGSPEGDAIFDAMKMIRMLMYFFVNTIIVIFFRDVELMLLNENHNIDDEFFNLGITLRHIHASLTNGIISFAFTIINSSQHHGGGNTTKSVINLEEVINKVFVEMKIYEFKELLMVYKGDPYEINNHDNKESWEKSFTYVLFNSRHSRKNSGSSQDSNKEKKQKEQMKKLKRAIRELGNLKENEIDGIVDILNEKAGKQKHYEVPYIFSGGGDQHYFLPGNDHGDDSDNEKDGSKYVFYKLYLLESLLNSEKFLKSFEIMFNLICRMINRVIKKLIPLARRMSGKMFQNVGAFVFSLGGPFTEILWFGFSSILALADAGKTSLSFVDDLGEISPQKTIDGYKFAPSSMINESETESLDDLLSLLHNTAQSGGGKSILETFDNKIVTRLNASY